MGPGESIIALLGAANRDPAQYPNPDRLDVAREHIRPMSFGGGIHHCLGAALARQQGHVALSALLTRFCRLELAGSPVRRPTFTLRGLESLPVVLDRAY
jgi:cytochrome P450